VKPAPMATSKARDAVMAVAAVSTDRTIALFHDQGAVPCSRCKNCFITARVIGWII
jgi:hypothetical protein